MEEWKNDDDEKETMNSDILIVGARCDILETRNIILPFTCPSLLLAVPLVLSALSVLLFIEQFYVHLYFCVALLSLLGRGDAS